MHSNPTNSTKRLKQSLDPIKLQPLTQISGNRLSNNGIPTLIIQLNPLIKPTKKEIPLSKVPLKLFGNIVIVPNFLISVGNFSQLKIAIMSFEVARPAEVIVMDFEEGVFGVLFGLVQVGLVGWGLLGVEVGLGWGVD